MSKETRRYFLWERVVKPVVVGVGIASLGGPSSSKKAEFTNPPKPLKQPETPVCPPDSEQKIPHETQIAFIQAIQDIVFHPSTVIAGGGDVPIKATASLQHGATTVNLEVSLSLFHKDPLEGKIAVSLVNGNRGTDILCRTQEAYDPTSNEFTQNPTRIRGYDFSAEGSETTPLVGDTGGTCTYRLSDAHVQDAIGLIGSSTAPSQEGHSEHKLEQVQTLTNFFTALKLTAEKSGPGNPYLEAAGGTD